MIDLPFSYHSSAQAASGSESGKTLVIAVESKTGAMQHNNPVGPGPEQSFVLITPAKNEGQFIRQVLESVVAQTRRPLHWVIVDDGSTDDTAKIVQDFVNRYTFIHLVRLESNRKRQFSSKVIAFNAGLEKVKDLRYSFIGNLDADITLDADYFKAVLDAFDRDPRLGISGGRVFTTVDGAFVCRDNTADSVGGAVQLFRAECFEAIGGYKQLPYGGIDAAAEINARAKGWVVRKIDRNVYEHRKTGSAHKPLRGSLNEGLKFHSLGYSTIFFVSRCAFRLFEHPRVLGSLLALGSFITAHLRRFPIYLDDEVVAYLRAEQNAKLSTMLKRFLPRILGGGRSLELNGL